MFFFSNKPNKSRWETNFPSTNQTLKSVQLIQLSKKISIENYFFKILRGINQPLSKKSYSVQNHKKIAAFPQLVSYKVCWINYQIRNKAMSNIQLSTKPSLRNVLCDASLLVKSERTEWCDNRSVAKKLGHAIYNIWLHIWFPLSVAKIRTYNL